MNKKFSFLAFALLMGAAQALADVDPRMEQGARFEAQGNYEMALGEYRAILAEQPKNAGAYFAAAEVRMKMKDYSGALANYRLAYKFDSRMSAAYEGAAKVYEALGQKAKAEAERAKDPKNNPVAEEPAAAAPAAPAAESAAVAEPAKAEPAKAETAVKEEPKSESVAAAPAKEDVKAEPAPVAKAEPAAKVEPAPVAKAESKVDTKVEAKAEPAPAVKAEVKEEKKADVADPFERGKALLAEGNYKDAALAWREVLKKTPGHAGAYFYAGVTRFEMGEYEKAEFNLKKGLEYKEEGNDANYYLARIYEKTGKRDQEKKFLAAYLKKAGPGGKFRAAIEDRLNALKAEEAAKAEAKDEKVAVEETAKTAESAKPAEVASVPAAQADAEVATSADVVAVPSIANANLLFKAGSFEPALQMYKTLLEAEQSPDERYFTMLQMGNIYREMRDFHSAVTRYREVVQQFPDSDWATEAERALEDAVWLEKHAKDLPPRKR